MLWKRFLCYWPFIRRNPPITDASPTKASNEGFDDMFMLALTSIRTNSLLADDSRRYGAQAKSL